jgi:hypothetical protein
VLCRLATEQSRHQLLHICPCALLLLLLPPAPAAASQLTKTPCALPTACCHRDALFAKGLLRVQQYLAGGRDNTTCPICLGGIKPTEAIWACGKSCFALFHMTCIQVGVVAGCVGVGSGFVFVCLGGWVDGWLAGWGMSVSVCLCLCVAGWVKQLRHRQLLAPTPRVVAVSCYH